MPGATSFPIWHDLRLCYVESPSTVWLHQHTSQAEPSPQQEAFHHMEKLLNKSLQRYCSQPPRDLPYPKPTVGDCVAAKHKSRWYRGRVQDVYPSFFRVFLLDYGTPVDVQGSCLIPWTHNQWTSVPYQAKKVHLFGVLPKSLTYTVVNSDLKLVPQASKMWDEAAFNFVQKVAKLKPPVDFAPVNQGADGCFHGLLWVRLDEEWWAAALGPTHPQYFLPCPHATKTLSRLLVYYDFAVWDGEAVKRLIRKLGKESDSILSQLGLHDQPMHATNSPIPPPQKSEDLLARFLTSCEEWRGRKDDSWCSEDDGQLRPDEGQKRPDLELERSNIGQEKPNEGQGGPDEDQEIPDEVQGQPEGQCGMGERQKQPGGARGLAHLTKSSLTDSSRLLVAEDQLSWVSSSVSSQPAVQKKALSVDNFTAVPDASVIPCPSMVMQQLLSSYLVNPPCKAGSLHYDEKKSEDSTNCHDKLWVQCVQAAGPNITAAASTHLLGSGVNVCTTACFPQQQLGLPHEDDNVKDNSTASSQFTDEPHVTVVADVTAVVPHERSSDTEDVQDMKQSAAAHECNSEENVLVVDDIAKICNDASEKKDTNNEQGQDSLHLNESFMSDTRDVWTRNVSLDLQQDEFQTLTIQGCGDMPRVARLYRVFVGGHSGVGEQEVMVEGGVVGACLHGKVREHLKCAGLRPTRHQSFAWPALVTGKSSVMVGGRQCGKTLGYLVPLLSHLLDHWQPPTAMAEPGAGPLLVVVCGDWHSAKCASDSLVGMLPASFSLQVLTAWGGCGNQEEEELQVEVAAGCEMLVTTPPCLVRLLTGDAATSLARCHHLVIDDAHISLHHFCEEIKIILKAWGEGRRKHGHPNLPQQLVVVASRWTKLLSSLTEMLTPSWDPTILISAPWEAAVATRVPHHSFFVSDESEVFTLVVRQITTCHMKQRNLVFVKDEHVAIRVSSLLQAKAVYCVVVPRTAIMWQMKQVLSEWHTAQEVTLVVCQGAESHLLRHNLANADTIFHTCIPSFSKFSIRYSFMTSKFSTDLCSGKPSSCEAYVVLPRKAMLLASITEELQRVCSVPEDVLRQGDESKVQQTQHRAVCHYLKAFGACLDKTSCRFRHHFQASDISGTLPRAGEVTFEVVRVLNASRYLARLVEHKGTTEKVNLGNHYSSLFLAVQQYFADTTNHEPLSQAQVGMHCVVQDGDTWARAHVIAVDYTSEAPLLTAFLVDEGKEINVSIRAAMKLPSHLAVVPKLIVEVYLCSVQPMDCDRNWTLQATQLIHDLFTEGQGNRFVGKVVLTLGQTLWLSPVVEVVQVDKTRVSRWSVQQRLLSEGFGTNNPTHMDSLRQLCKEAQICLEQEELWQSDWINKMNLALHCMGDSQASETLSNQTDVVCDRQVGVALNNQTDLDCDSQAGVAFNSQAGVALNNQTDVAFNNQANVVQSSYTVVPEPCDTFHSGDDSGAYYKQVKISVNNESSTVEPTFPVSQLQEQQNGKSFASRPHRHQEKGMIMRPPIPQEALPLGVDVQVRLCSIGSPQLFHILLQDKLEALENLESEIETLSEYLNTWEMETVKKGLEFHRSSVSVSDYCIARLGDGLYHRGYIRSEGEDGGMDVFFLDHGQTVTLPCHHVHPCPMSFLRQLPAQAVACSLAHIHVPMAQQEEAGRVMVQLAQKASSAWMAHALQVIETDEGPLYDVELTNNSNVKMWEQLIQAGVAVLRSKDEEVSEDKGRAVKFMPFLPQEAYSGTSAAGKSPLVGGGVCIPCVGGEEAANSLLGVPAVGTNISCVRSPIVNTCRTFGLSLSSRLNGQRDCGFTTRAHRGTDDKERLGSIGQGQTVAARLFQELVLAMPSVAEITGKFSPMSSWGQQEENVHLTIHLVGVQEYRCHLGPSRLVFMTVVGEKFYIIDEKLEKEVEAKQSRVNACGTSVTIILKKAGRETWARLFARQEKLPWLRRDCWGVGSVEDLSEEEEKVVWGVARADRPYERGGLPAGVSDSDSVSDGFSDEDDADFMLS